MSQPFYLSLFIGPGHPVLAPQDLMEALISVEVQNSTKGQSGCQINFALGKNSRINRVLLPTGFFDYKTRVRVVVTVGGRATPIFEGIIAKYDLAPSNEAAQSTLTLTCLDLTALMDFIDLTGTPLPPAPTFVLANLILAPYAALGIVPVVVPTKNVFAPNPLEQIKVREGTDYNYLQLLARRAGYVFYLEPGPAVGISTAYWGPEVRVGGPQPSLNVNMDAETNVESLTFSYDGQANYVPVLWQMLRVSKTPIPVPIPNSLRRPLGVRPPAKDRVEVIPGGPKLSAGEVVLKALSLVSTMPEAVSASGSLDVTRYGQPLKARQLVAVRGAGLAYDGLYYADRITHNIKPGEYKQNFSLTRNQLVSNIAKVSA
jgi:hypothetical protein